MSREAQREGVKGYQDTERGARPSLLSRVHPYVETIKLYALDAVYCMPIIAQ